MSRSFSSDRFTIANHYAQDRIITIPNVLSPSDCKTLINQAEEAGFKPSALSGGGHGQHPTTGARTSQFYVREDEKLAERIWDKVGNFVPKSLRHIKYVPYMHTVTHGDEFEPISISPHMRFYKYDPGQFVLKHDDYRMERFRRDSKTGQYYQQMTFLTLLVYLNDDFENGNTAFWTKYAQVGTSGHCRFLRNDNDNDFNKANPPADLKIKPQTGMVLINDHMIQHEGEAPQKGVKYIVRTDILHEKPVPKERVTLKFTKNAEFSEWGKHYEPSCLHYTE
ncbi:MAG: 2OG-Fe(II) oxygenase family protein [Candidatus Kariarchaeaceae archaeon]|jgi:hypothetical protein